MGGSPDRWTGTAARPLLLDHLIGGLLGKHRPYGLESLSTLGPFHAPVKITRADADHVEHRNKAREAVNSAALKKKQDGQPESARQAAARRRRRGARVDAGGGRVRAAGRHGRRGRRRRRDRKSVV